MTKPFTTLLLLFGLFLGVYGQTSLTFKDHAYRVGDTHHFYLTEKADEGGSGPNQVWDFSRLKVTGELTSKMLSPSETPGAAIADANCAIKESDNFFYFKVTDESVIDYGFSGCGGVFKLDKPIVRFKYPCTYGYSQSGDFQGSNISNPGAKITGTYKIEADAYGKLVLPNNVTFDNVIRVKSVRKFTGSNAAEVTYKWYSADVRYPLLTIIKSDDNSKSIATLTAYYADASQLKLKAVEETSATSGEGSISAYPNPFGDNLILEYRLNNAGFVKVDLLDNSGKLVQAILSENQSQGGHRKTLTSEISSLSPGIYYIKAIIDGNVIVKKVVKY